MKNIYSNLLKTALGLVLTVCAVNVSVAQCDIPFPDNSVWGTQFDGGLDGWTAFDGELQPRTDADGNDIGWNWSADGSVDAGSFSGGTIESASVCNGAVSFNSDFLDNNGEGAANIGFGICPAPCGGILMSPTIDLSEAGTSDFVLQFASRHRQFNSDFNVLVSIDDGATWIDTVSVFGGPDGNYPEHVTNGANLMEPTWRLPLCELEDEREVRIAFWYTGNYYFWTLDDVHILAETQSDMRPNENWYAVSVIDAMPYDQTFPLAFLADVENRSPIASAGSTLTVDVTDQDGNNLHTQDLAYAAADGCAFVENIPFPELYVPAADPAAGDEHTVSYTLTESEGDADMTNNTIDGQIRFTDNEYLSVLREADAGTNYLGGTKFAGDHLNESWGRQFYVKNGTRNGMPLEIESVDFGFVINGDVNQMSLVVTVYEWLDGNNDGVVDADPSNEKIKLGSAPTIFGATLGDATRSITANPVDAEGNRIQLKDNSHYIVMVHYEAFTSGATIFPLMADFGLTQFAHGAADLAYQNFYEDNSAGVDLSALAGQLGGIGVTADDADTDRVYNRNFFGSLYTNMVIAETGVGAEDINENIGINVYPNPAQTVINAEIALEETSETVQVELVDVTGKVVMTKNYNNIKEQTVTLNIESLQTGLYIMNIRTDDGINTQKFNVVGK